MAYISCSGLGSMHVSFTGVKWIGGETLQYKMRSTSSFSRVQNLRNVQPHITHTHTHTLKADIIVVTSTTLFRIPPTNLMFCCRLIMAFLMREEEIVPALHKHIQTQELHCESCLLFWLLYKRSARLAAESHLAEFPESIALTDMLRYKKCYALDLDCISTIHTFALQSSLSVLRCFSGEQLVFVPTSAESLWSLVSLCIAYYEIYRR